MEDGKVSPSAAEHIRACKPCRLVFERVQSLCSMVALKAYEKPDAGFDARLTASVLRGIREDAKAPASLWEAVRDWFVLQPAPALRATAVAAVVAVVGIGSFTVFQQEAVTPSASPVVAQQPAIPVAPEPVEVAAVEPVQPQPVVADAGPRLVDPNLPVVFIASNRNPMLFERPGYGGIQTAPVSYQLNR